jgi:zinc protease
VDLLGGGAADHRDPFLFTWVARVKKEDQVARVEKEVTAALEALGRDLVPAERLDQVRAHMTYSFAMQLDTPSSVAQSLAHYLSMTGDAESVNRLYALYRTVTPEQIRDVARRTFAPQGRTLVTLRQKAGS